MICGLLVHDVAGRLVEADGFEDGVAWWADCIERWPRLRERLTRKGKDRQPEGREPDFVCRLHGDLPDWCFAGDYL
jgi:hypothetical protein